LFYLNALSNGVTGVHIFSVGTGQELPSSPLPSNAPGLAEFTGWVPAPDGPFFYFTGSSGIEILAVDPNTGLVSTIAAFANGFGPGGILLLTTTPDKVPHPTPEINLSPSALQFGGVAVGQQSAPLQLLITSAGALPLSVSGITATANFSLVSGGTCVGTAFKLATQTSCTIQVTFTPSGTGAANGVLTISSNATGSATTQTVALSGSGNPDAPGVSLAPGSLTFPLITEGTTGTAQNVTLTSSGTATLHITGVSMSGGNAADFSLATTCQGALAVNATCTITVNFAPLAAGVRLTSVSITDDAGNQSISVSGTANPATTFGPTPNGSMSASISAGQTAQYNLQAMPGAGFNGTLTFTCSGVPFGATCTVPSNVSVTNGAAAPFNISVATVSAAALAPTPITTPASPFDRGPLVLATVLAAMLAFLLASRVKPIALRPVPVVAFALLIVALISFGDGCGGAGSSTPPPPIQSAAAPAIMPNGGTFSTGYPTVTLTDSTPGASIRYTIDGTMPNSASTMYTAPFALNSAATVQAIATASGYSASSVASAAFKFKTPSRNYTIMVTPTAMANGSTKQLQLSPIQLTLNVQ